MLDAFKVRNVLSAILQATVFVFLVYGYNFWGLVYSKYPLEKKCHSAKLVVWYPVLLYPCVNLWYPGIFFRLRGIIKAKWFDNPIMTRTLIEAGPCLHLLTAYHIKGLSLTVTQVKQTHCDLLAFFIGMMLIKCLLWLFCHFEVESFSTSRGIRVTRREAAWCSRLLFIGIIINPFIRPHCLSLLFEGK